MRKNMNQDVFTFTTLDATASEKIDAPRYSYWRSVWRKFFSNKVSVALLIILVIVLALAFIQPLFSNYDFMNVDNINDFGARYQFPSLQNWFGTDGNGHSLFDAVWAGARTSVMIGFVSTIITMVVGVIVGAFWGYSKRVDKVMIEIYNIVSNVPTILIVLVLSYAFGAGFWNLIFALTITSWVSIAYSIRVQVLIMRDREYNLASQTLGTPTPRIIVKNILPYIISVIVTHASRLLPIFISNEVFLSFLGVGLNVSIPSLGRIISKYTVNISSHPYLFWIPVAVLALVTISLYVVGQSLADASDPRTHM